MSLVRYPDGNGNWKPIYAGGIKDETGREKTASEIIDGLDIGTGGGFNYTPMSGSPFEFTGTNECLTNTEIWSYTFSSGEEGTYSIDGWLVAKNESEAGISAHTVALNVNEKTHKLSLYEANGKGKEFNFNHIFNVNAGDTVKLIVEVHGGTVISGEGLVIKGYRYNFVKLG